MDLLAQVRKRFRGSGLSVSAIAVTADVPRTTVRDLLNNNDANPKLDNLRRVCEALGLRVVISRRRAG
jgi:DNA-binding phage protein